jgi:hypothetical protein
MRPLARHFRMGFYLLTADWDWKSFLCSMFWVMGDVIGAVPRISKSFESERGRIGDRFRHRAFDGLGN